MELVSGKSFLQYYIEYMLAYQERGRRDGDGDEQLIIPLAIMTSDETHAKTVEFLQEHKNFGMEPDQITIMKQEKVPALMV